MPPEPTNNPIENRLSSGLFRSQNVNRIAAIELGRIKVNPNQPRKFFDADKLNDLALSLKEKGQIQPIVVRLDEEANDGTYIIVAGERRYRASQLNGAATIECIVSKGDAEEIALIENLQRDDLKPIEEAEAIKRLMDARSYSQGQVADLVGASRVAINELLALTRLPEAIRAACRTSDKATKSLLLTIARMDGEEQQLAAWARFESGDETISTVKKARDAKAGKSSDEYAELAKRIEQFAKQLQKMGAPTTDQLATITKAKRALDKALKTLSNANPSAESTQAEATDDPS
jgi:ParB family chromosome partitioning protein